MRELTLKTGVAEEVYVVCKLQINNLIRVRLKSS